MRINRLDPDELDRISTDFDLYADIRTMLLMIDCSNNNLLDFDDFASFYAANRFDFESDRTTDHHRIFDILRSMPRAQLTMLAIEHSLCPRHFIDFAICFDDDDPDCRQIRDCFPDTHDT